MWKVCSWVGFFNGLFFVYSIAEEEEEEDEEEEDEEEEDDEEEEEEEEEEEAEQEAKLKDMEQKRTQGKVRALCK